MTGPRFCCCGGTDPCAHSCDFDESYNFSAMSFQYFWVNYVAPYAVGSDCCFDLISAEVNIDGIQGSPFNVTKLPNPDSVPCCYNGIFAMLLTGTVTYSWAYYPPFGAPAEVYSTTYPINVEVPAEINITCQGGAWYYEIAFCHFQVACSTPILTNDCEEAHATVDVGLRCAGGTITYWSELKALDLVTPADIWGINFCANNIFGCGDPTDCSGSSPCSPTPGSPHNSGLLDYNAGYLSEGADMFCGIYTTEECSEQDPFPPCETAYSMANQGGYIFFGTMGETQSQQDDWCRGQEIIFDQGCSSNSKYITFTVPTVT